MKKAIPKAAKLTARERSSVAQQKPTPTPTPRKRTPKRSKLVTTIQTNFSAHRRFQCDSCGWIFDPIAHAKTDFEDLPEGWGCEKCLADRDHFQPLIPGEDDLEAEPGPDTLALSLRTSTRLVSIKYGQPDVLSLKRRYDKGRLKLQPDFQRYEVWPIQTKSQLIESILLELPIPSIYLAEEDDSEYVVIDGQQRLGAIFGFLSGLFKLKGLGIYSSLNGSSFQNLPDNLQELIESRTLDVTEIKKGTDPEVRFQLFERLNRGSIKLNDQELRNCIYRGRYNDYLKRLASHPDLRKILKLKAPHKRMVDVELVLRFMAFYDQTYLKFPDKKTNKFLSDQMQSVGPIQSDTNLAKTEKRFLQALKAAISIFGEKVFRRFEAGNELSPDGKWERRINRALMDVVLYNFAQYNQGDLIAKSDDIRNMAIELMSDDKFADLLKHTISETKRVKERFSIWSGRFDNIMQGKRNPRAFSDSIRRTLFKSDPTCARCNNRILDLDDAHADHIVPFSKGGQTERKNAQLLHRFCNQSKGSRSLPKV